MKLTIAPNITPLSGKDSEATAHIVENYPYGGYRTQMRYWVETREKFGQRIVMQSLNPKTGEWNKPHAGAYSSLICLYINNDNGHCEGSHVGVYQSKADLDLWETTFAAVLTDWQKKHLAALRNFLETKSPSSYFEFTDAQMEAYKAQMLTLNAWIQPLIDGAKLAGTKLSPTLREEYNTKRKAIIQNVLTTPKE